MTAVSIITPAYRSERFIERAVRSVLMQTHVDWEMVIASDDGQDYLALLKERGVADPRLRCVGSGGVGTGPSNARNAALDAAKYDIIVSLDSDDQLHKDALATFIPAVARHAAAYSAIRFVDSDTGGDLENYNRPVGAGMKTLEEVFASNIHTFNCIAYDRRHMRHLRWPPQFPRLTDVVFFAMCYDSLGGIWHIPEPLYIYHHRQGSLCNSLESNQEIKDWFERILAMLRRGELAFNRASTARAFDAMLCKWIELETLLLQEMAEQKYTGYQDFLRRNRNRLYSPR